MSLTRTVVNRPTTLLIVFALLFGFGIYTARDLAIDLFPEIEAPFLVVLTAYDGAAPEEVERGVTRPLESQLSNVSNIEKITSFSSEGSSQVSLEFTWGTDMAEASNEVRDRLEFVRDFLPSDARSPQIFKFDPSQFPIMTLQVSGNRSTEELRQLAEDVIQPRLEQIEGVALASVSGGRDRAVRVEVPQDRLEAYNLTLTQVSQAIRSQNVQVAAGRITEGTTNYLIRTAGEYGSIEEIKDTVIAYRPFAGFGAGGNPSANAAGPDISANYGIRLREVANVFDGFRREDTTVFVNGEPGIIVVVQRQSGTNSVQTADNVLERLDSINAALPVGVELGVVLDTTQIIRNSLQDVSSSAILGAVFAVLVLFIFLRSFRTTAVIAVSIPISIVITLMLMYFSGLTLNIMTLTGLALGVGMLVDNSIVVLENIYRYREKGSKLTTSAVLGTQEMLTAITASTLTTICVFLPVVLFRRQLRFVGELFSGLAFTVVISLVASLVVAVLLIPVLSSHYLRIESKKQRPLVGFRRVLDNLLDGFFGGLDRGYRAALGFALRHRWLVVVVVVVLFGGSLAMIPIMGFQFAPSQEDDFVQVSLTMPQGTSLDVTRSVLQQLEQIAKHEIQGYKDMLVSAGDRSFFGLGGARSNRGTLSVTLPEFQDRIDTSFDVQEKLRAHFDSFPGARFSFQQGGGGGPFSAPPIDIIVTSEDLERGKQTADRIADLLRDRFSEEVAEPTITLDDGLPELRIAIDRARAYELGLNMQAVGQEVRAYVDGIASSRYRSRTDEYDILVISDEASRSTAPDLERIFVMSNAGRRIPLSSFATLQRTTGPVSIRRENQRRTVNVRASLAPGVQLSDVDPQIRAMVMEEIAVDDALLIEFGGDYAELMRLLRTFAVIVVVSILLVYGVMASQFESFLDPFIIVFTIPLLTIGVVGLYYITGETLNVFTAVGAVMLVGIVVNNGIVLVDYTNLMRRRGMPLFEACIEAGGNRLRPILMTSLTTILALVPVAFVEGEGSSLVQPIARTVVGGLGVATFLTLFLVPTLYSAFNQFSDRVTVRRERRRDEKHQRKEQQLRREIARDEQRAAERAAERERRAQQRRRT
ncbi:MAG: efflux RND transporter permease subunit [Spirochaetaceae bacterium]|nr:MAG: efflux RND transporter permease subunit [Spirochaetaceae bacterium]